MQPVRVVTYNVRYFGHGTKGIASTKRAMNRIACALAALDPLADVICLQEVETTSLRSNLAHRSPDGETQLSRLMTMLHDALVAAGKRDTYEAYYFPAHAYKLSKTPLYTTGLAVVARRDFKVSHHNAGQPHDITFRKIHPVKRLKQTRICAHLRVVHKSGTDLDIFNTHLSLPTTFSRAFWFEPRRMGWGPNQLEEAKNLVAFVEKEKRSERFVVVGDFNALPGSPVYRALLEAGLTDPFASHHALDEEQLVAWPTAGFMNMRMHLDHVFSGRGLRWTGFEGTHRFGQKGGAFRGLSDHVPILGRVHVRVVGGDPPRVRAMNIVAITGACGALGSEVAARLAKDGYKLALFDTEHHRDRLESAVAKHGGPDNAFAFAGDFSRESTWRAALGGATETFGRAPSHAALIAGTWAGGELLHRAPDSTYTKVMSANVDTAYRGLKELLPAMVGNRHGSIVVVGSRAAVEPWSSAGSAAYASSKAAVVAMAQAVAREVLDQGVRINAILPSTLDTPANRTAMPKADPSKWVSLASAAAVISFLLSDEARDLSGVALPVYGQA